MTRRKVLHKSLHSLAIAGLLSLSPVVGAAPAQTPAETKSSAKKPAPKPDAKPTAAKSNAGQPAVSKPAAAKPAATKPVTASSTPKAVAPGKTVPTPPPKPPVSATATRPPPNTAAPAAIAARTAPALALASSTSTPAMDVSAVKRALDHVRGRRPGEAAEVARSIGDPLARKLVEWAILRSDDAGHDFGRYTRFIAANPGWPSIVTLRRRAESMLFTDRQDPATVRAFFAENKPLSGRGRIALARALHALGDRKGAEELAREAWRTDAFNADTEQQILASFGEVFTRDDHKARMDRRLYEKDDTEAGVRAAARLGGHEPAIAKARMAMLEKGGNKALLDAVPAAARSDTGYKFARIQMLRRADQISEAAALMQSVGALDDSHDLDEWWIERRLLARKLLDENNPKLAYAVARDATTPERSNYRAEHQFTAGWIAFRFLNDPSTAYAHFKRIDDGQENPIALSRAAYWQGRAAEALGRSSEAQAHFRQAARFPTAYYGQIARAKAGLGEIALNPAPQPSVSERARLSRLEVVRAVELLYAVEARELVNTMMADLGDKSEDSGALFMLTELAHKNSDARGMLLVGKLGLGRGHPLEHAAFPVIGVPKYSPIGPEVEPAIVYSIARQESWFNPRTISSANAMGLMQVVPGTGAAIAKKYGVGFDRNKLQNDSVFNVQLGAAVLGSVIQDYRGSYILSFVAYNAGPGRVREWVQRYGDPRDPKVDPIDWVERIPFSETRNYVQRVMENVQVYRVRFGGPQKLLIEADLRRGATVN